MTYQEAKEGLLTLTEPSTTCPYSGFSWKTGGDSLYDPNFTIPCAFYNSQGNIYTIDAVMFLMPDEETVLWRCESLGGPYYLIEAPVPVRFTDPALGGWRIERWSLKAGPSQITDWVKEHALL